MCSLLPCLSILYFVSMLLLWVVTVDLVCEHQLGLWYLSHWLSGAILGTVIQDLNILILSYSSKQLLV